MTMTTIAEGLAITKENFGELLVVPYERYLRYYLAHVIGTECPEDIEDALGKTWENVWRTHTSARYTTRQSLRNWLIMIAVNAARDVLRKRKHYAAALPLDTITQYEERSVYYEETLPLVNEHSLSLEDQVILQDMVQQAFAELEIDEQELIWKICVIGYQYKDLHSLPS